MPYKMTITLDQSLPTFEQLPKVFAIKLDNLAAISLSGEEQNKYLQGQVTCDVNTVNEHNLLNGSHCDAKGKVFSVFRLILRNNANLLIQPKTTVQASLTELKKFGVFAKVTIEAVEDLTYLAVCGAEAGATLAKHVSTLPSESSPVETDGTTTVIYIAGKTPRYLVIDGENKVTDFANNLNITTYTHKVWDLLEITEGFPTLSESAISDYVPQMLNLQAVDAISFTKGCYLGQETVARMQYLRQKQTCFIQFKRSNSFTQLLDDQSIIEKQLGENWRKAGDLLASYTADNGEYYLQAVLASDTDENTNLRIKDAADSELHLQTLPYSLTTQD